MVSNVDFTDHIITKDVKNDFASALSDATLIVTLRGMSWLDSGAALCNVKTPRQSFG